MGLADASVEPILKVFTAGSDAGEPVTTAPPERDKAEAPTM